MPVDPHVLRARYPEAVNVQLRGDLARQVRRVHERFAPASGGRLTLGALMARAVDAGLGIVAAELLAACEAATDVRPSGDHDTSTGTGTTKEHD